MKPSTLTFDQLITDSYFKKALKSIGITTPTPIQEKAFRLIKERNDVICQSSTGSGKTLAFAIPVAEGVEPGAGLQTVVLVPTRELAEQVADEFRKVTKFSHLNIQKIYGGVPIHLQIRKISKANIIIATPGRLCDLIKRGVVSFEDVTTAVLDEADTMLDMGFIHDVEFILKATPKDRQTLMFSATIPKPMEKIIRRQMKNPQWVKVKEHVEKGKLKQYAYEVPARGRFNLLLQLLRKETAPYAIVFCGTRRTVDAVAYNLNKNNVDAHAIHGGLTQSKRKKIMSSFHGKRTHILVATDIAARGIDVKMLSHVYNYDVPQVPQEYVHRIGRTARAGTEGTAITLVAERDQSYFRQILRLPQFTIEKLELPEITGEFVPLVQARRSFDQNQSRGNFHRRKGAPSKGAPKKGSYSGKRKSNSVQRRRAY